MSSKLMSAAIAVSVLADTFDGRWARLFKRDSHTREFGTQLDSLADAVTAGVVPVITLWATVERPAGPFQLLLGIAGLAFLAAAVTRLGHFNIASGDDANFTGLPVPAAALFVCTAILWPLDAMISSVVLFSTAAAMVAPVRIPRPRGVGLAAFAAWAVVLATLHLWRLGGS